MLRSAVTMNNMEMQDDRLILKQISGQWVHIVSRHLFARWSCKFKLSVKQEKRKSHNKSPSFQNHRPCQNDTEMSLTAGYMGTRKVLSGIYQFLSREERRMETIHVVSKQTTECLECLIHSRNNFDCPGFDTLLNVNVFSGK